MALDQNFQVNLGGVIRLLSDHLYSGPEVYIRELLQNGVDALTARQHLDPTHDGSIRIELIDSPDSSARTISVEDNGIGLTEEEVHQFLATIGQSSKSGEFSRDDFIGQFGIGLLSGFVLSDEITVITKSAKGNSSPVEWKGQADGTYSVRKLDTQISAGTTVYLRCKPGKEEYFQDETVERLLRHYGNHLPHEIEFTTSEAKITINEPPPWRKTFANSNAEQDAYLEYGREVFGVDFLDVIPLQSSAGGIMGAAFVLPYSASPASRQAHRVYLKDMLLAESVEGMLPEWAFFVRCVINANALTPNAARDSFHENEALLQARKELGLCLRRYLTGLAEYDRQALDRILQLHYLPIKSLAVEDDDFLRLIVDWLPFETTTGTTTLEEYCQQSSTIRYVRDVDQFRQIASVASAQNICIFNGGYSYDAALLERVGHEFTDRKVERVDPSDLVQNFEELTLDESEAAFDFMKLADVVLQKYKCRAEARKFDPADLPTLYSANDSATFLRSVEQSKEEVDEMWSGILDNVTQAATADAYAQLVLNFRNPLIQKLSTQKDRQLLQQVIEILYLQSLLLGHYPLAQGERGILAGGLLGLIELFVDKQET